MTSSASTRQRPWWWSNLGFLAWMIGGGLAGTAGALVIALWATDWPTWAQMVLGAVGAYVGMAAGIAVVIFHDD